MRSPGLRSSSRPNTAGPLRVSTWPTMTDEPGSPGTADEVNQPTFVKSVGTCSAPW